DVEAGGLVDGSPAHVVAAGAAAQADEHPVAPGLVVDAAGLVDGADGAGVGAVEGIEARVERAAGDVEDAHAATGADAGAVAGGDDGVAVEVDGARAAPVGADNQHLRRAKRAGVGEVQ